MKSTAQLTIRPKIAKRYALALLDCAQEKKQVEPVYKDLMAIAEGLEQSDELKALFQNPEFSSQTLRTVLDTLFRNKVNPLALQFIYLLARHDRLDLLKEIYVEFEKLYFEYKEIRKVKIISARELKTAQLETIAQRLKARFKKDIQYDVEINPRLIGGFKIQIDDFIYDFSVQNQLEKFKNLILSS